MYAAGVVVDDLDMRITHVQIPRRRPHFQRPSMSDLRALCSPRSPLFATSPSLLGPDKSVSKRHGAPTSHYRTEGFLPEPSAIFLGLLGWSPGNDANTRTNDLIQGFARKASAAPTAF